MHRPDRVTCPRYGRQVLRNRVVPSVLVLAVVATVSLTGCSASNGDPCTHAVRAADLAAEGDMVGASAELDKIGTVADVTIGTAVASLALGIEGDTDIAAGIAAVQDACD